MRSILQLFLGIGPLPGHGLNIIPYYSEVVKLEGE
jgi:hypothetical protein